MSGKGYAMLMAAVAGAAIGGALGRSIAFGMTGPKDSPWVRGEFLGTLLQYGGAAVGAIIAFVLVAMLLGGD